jgi:hypothetical protein
MIWYLIDNLSFNRLYLNLTNYQKCSLQWSNNNKMFTPTPWNTLLAVATKVERKAHSSLTSFAKTSIIRTIKQLKKPLWKSHSWKWAWTRILRIYLNAIKTRLKTKMKFYNKEHLIIFWRLPRRSKRFVSGLNKVNSMQGWRTYLWTHTLNSSTCYIRRWRLWPLS